MPNWKKKTIAYLSHPYEPVYSSTSKILILGSFPSNSSRKLGFYQMQPQNRFWLIMEKIFDIEFKFKNTDGQRAIEERRSFLLSHDIALWDVIKSCYMRVDWETKIEDEKPNNFYEIFMKANIAQIFCLGKPAFKYWNKLCKATVKP